MTPFERSLSKLSENHKIIEIESTEFKFMAAEESPNHHNNIILWEVVYLSTTKT